MRSTGTALFSLRLCESSSWRGGARPSAAAERLRARERQWLAPLRRFADAEIRAGTRTRAVLLVVNGPTIRPLSAMSAAQEDRARRAGDAEIMASRQVAVQPVPHVEPLFEVRDLFYRKVGAAQLRRQGLRSGELTYFRRKMQSKSQRFERLRVAIGTFCLMNKYGTRNYGFRTGLRKIGSICRDQDAVRPKE